jgi:hypothetical protein
MIHPDNLLKVGGDDSFWMEATSRKGQQPIKSLDKTEGLMH